MNIITIPVGAYQANCYLVGCPQTGKAAAIDCGAEADKIIAAAKKQGWQITHILLTHGHMDHITAAQEVKEKTGAETYIGKGDQDFLTDKSKSLEDFCYQTNYPNTPPDHVMEEGEEIQVGELTFRVIETPGHTPGGVCLACQDVLFTGDTLFYLSCGRTDFYGGDMAKMLASLKKLALLKENYKVMPGHGESTTLAFERECNPYMKEGMRR